MYTPVKFSLSKLQLYSCTQKHVAILYLFVTAAGHWASVYSTCEFSAFQQALGLKGRLSW